MNAQDLINWGELSRLLTSSRMNIRKNRIPEKYREDIQKLVKHIENWQTEIEKPVKTENERGENI